MADASANRRAYVRDALDACGLKYVWQPGEEPVAALTTQLPNRPSLNLTVRHTGPVLQLIAHGALAGPADAQTLADRDTLNQDWAFGRAYWVESHSSWDLSVGLYAPERAPPAQEVRAALASLADAPALIAKGQPPVLLVEPARARAEVMAALAPALTAAGLHPVAQHSGEVQVVQMQMDQLRVQVDWFVAGSLLIARGQPLGVQSVAATDAVLRRLNALNARLDIGGVGLAYDVGLGYGWVSQPVAWFDMASDALRWTGERAASWAEAAHKAARG